MVCLVVWCGVASVTEQDDDAGEDGDERSGAEACRQEQRLHITGQDGVFGVTAAHSDQECVGAAERRDAVITDLDGQSVNVLRHPAETSPDHHHRSRTVCRVQQETTDSVH
ncbi:uncharacterized [Tachysurus ichikawai]